MSPYTMNEFADQMGQVFPVLIKEFARRQSNELYKGKITLTQYLVLDFLGKNADSKMTDMARFMDVTTAAMTGIVERLVRDRYALRTSDSKDRRLIKIKLTSRGQEVVRKVNQQRRQMIMDIFGRISQEEREGYLSILEHIRDILVLEKSGA